MLSDADSLVTGDADLLVLKRDFAIPILTPNELRESLKIAALYATGSDAVADPEKALFWLQQTAKNNHRDAMLKLAQAYDKGQFGLAKSPEQASY